MNNVNSNFSVVIPIYNEQDNILTLYKEIIFVLNQERNFKYEIIFIDDFSIDKSKSIINKIKQNDEKVNLISNDKNCGQSFCINLGVHSARFDIIATLDGDGQNNPKDFLKLLDIYASSDYKLVGGIREKRKDSYVKIYSSIIANYVRSKILKDNCKDTGCAIKVFDKKLFISFPYFDGIHRFLPTLFKGFGYSTFFLPVDHRNRLHGKSKYGTFKRLFKGIIDIYRVKKILDKNKSNKIN